MSLYGVMWTSVSGMTAQSNRLGTIADNIANSNTTGYKRASTEFGSLILDSSPTSYTSGTVMTMVRNAIGEQGALMATSSITDLAVMGDGFFMVQGSDGTPYLTRAGAFTPDSTGNLVNASGFSLLGYPITSSDTGQVVNGFSGLQVVNIGSLPMRAAPTTEGTFRTNLPAGADAVADADLPSTNSAGAKYTDKTSLVTYDNLGNEVVLDIYTTKKEDGTWEVAAYNQADAASGGGFPYSSGPLSTTSLSFDPDNGNLASGSPTSIDIDIPGGKTMKLDLTGTTQLGGDYTVMEAEANGNAPAAVQHIKIDADGTLYAIYANGDSVPAFRIPLAHVPSPDSLRPESGNVYSLTPDSGDVQIGEAGSSGFGTVVSGALEQSTVDMATELTNMIDAQRSYTANSKVFQTGAELMDVVVNLKR